MYKNLAAALWRALEFGDGADTALTDTACASRFSEGPANMLIGWAA